MPCGRRDRAGHVVYWLESPTAAEGEELRKRAYTPMRLKYHLTVTITNLRPLVGRGEVDYRGEFTLKGHKAADGCCYGVLMLPSAFLKRRPPCSALESSVLS